MVIDSKISAQTMTPQIWKGQTTALQISACLFSCARESPRPWMLKLPQIDGRGIKQKY
jgi:hypothetical protein